ncbi:MAG: hormogonium polysaccharide biosynthesis glycosyltransferase HpsE [Chroococcales cyanobacterium]
MTDFTVAICTYNGASRIPDVLEKLRSQIGTDSINWEIIVVDNNSSDHTKQVIFDYQNRWSESLPLRYLFESQQGAAFARIRAVQEANSELIGFLDDDNLPEPDWVASAYQFGFAHPKVGAYGSQIRPNYEVDPSEELTSIAYFLAINEREGQPVRYEPQDKMLPPSAGLVVRKEAWLACVPAKPFLTGRTSKTMLTSEDLEALIYLQRAGWEIWHNPAMCIYHHIPSWRMKRDYLLKLVEGTGLARHHLRMLRLPLWQRPLAVPICFLTDLIKVSFYYLKYRHTLQTNLAAACHLKFLSSTLVSPFYLWQKSWKTQNEKGDY